MEKGEPGRRDGDDESLLFKFPRRNSDIALLRHDDECLGE
jgi:hypothetical protein